ncbi:MULTISPECIES: hypothetical protein [Streptomyces]|nr:MULTISPECIES: hypothetical protein [Streptomyces]
MDGGRTEFTVTVENADNAAPQVALGHGLRTASGAGPEDNS